MKTFFGGKFIEKETLKEVGISYPIKLEYYKDIHSDEFIRTNGAKYGISVVKTSYIPNNTLIENKDVARKIEKLHILFEHIGIKPGDKSSQMWNNRKRSRIWRQLRFRKL